MHIQGHGITADYDGHQLTVTGNNRASRIALRGQQHDAGPLVLERDDITSVDTRPPSMFTNGRLTVHTRNGDRYLLHYRRKHAPAFTELASALSQ